MSKISVIIPIYNSSVNLRESLNSYCKQYFDDIEFILIDDGSTDNSGVICNEYANLYNNIKVYHVEHNGVSKARNYGLNLCTGEYVAFLDSDDLIDPEMFVEMHNFAEEFKLDMVSCGIIMEIKTKKGYIKQNEIRSDNIIILDGHNQIMTNMLSLWEKSLTYNIVNKIYRIDIIKNNLIYFNNLTMGEDLDFNMQCLKNISSVGVLPQCFYHYIRERNYSSTSSYVNNWFNIRLKEHHKIINFFKHLNIYDASVEEFINKRFIMRVIGCIENEFNSKNIITLHKRYSNIKSIILNEDVQFSIHKIQNSSLVLKLLMLPIRLKNSFLSYIFGLILSFVRHELPIIFGYFKYK